MYDVNMTLFNQIENGLYKINKEGYRQGYIEIFPGNNNINRMMRIYVVPELVAADQDDDVSPIFAVIKGFRIIPLMSEAELASKLESNSRLPGMWYII